MRTESQGTQALEDFIAEIGAPYAIISDNARMQTGEVWKNILRKYNIQGLTTEPYHPQQNPAERRIQDVKRVALRIMDHTNTPETLWFHAGKTNVLPPISS